MTNQPHPGDIIADEDSRLGTVIGITPTSIKVKYSFQVETVSYPADTVQSLADLGMTLIKSHKEVLSMFKEAEVC
ncbi:hypothetical protein [Arcticibacter sp.]|uniref:hypothetical protein n=1 Tax=Arcticibacter sp. TaxID=1872630 RepID=UPI00388D895D